MIHHARLGSMEGNVFTIIGNRMKGRRACWSINGGNRLAALLCKHYSVNAAPQKDGKGYEFARNISIPSGMKWLKQISSFKSLPDLSF